MPWVPMPKARPRPRVSGVTYPIASGRNRELSGGVSGVPRILRSGSRVAMREMAQRRAAGRAMNEVGKNEQEGAY